MSDILKEVNRAESRNSVRTETLDEMLDFLLSIEGRKDVGAVVLRRYASDWLIEWLRTLNLKQRLQTWQRDLAWATSGDCGEKTEVNMAARNTLAEQLWAEARTLAF